MPAVKPAIHGHSIVLVGDFNPKIFQPAWFGAEGLIRNLEAEKADIQIVHPEVVVFKLEWMSLEVTRDRFVAGTLQEAYDEVIRDLVISTFRILRHTPLRVMGINEYGHYPIDSEEHWHRIGHTLAPKEKWDKILKNPGMKRLDIQAMRPDNLKGHVLVTVEPSSKIPIGLYLRVNDHFEAQKTEGSAGSDEVINILEANWAESHRRAGCYAEKLLEQL
jgi:hypothetical protein